LNHRVRNTGKRAEGDTEEWTVCVGKDCGMKWRDELILEGLHTEQQTEAQQHNPAVHITITEFILSLIHETDGNRPPTQHRAAPSIDFPAAWRTAS